MTTPVLTQKELDADLAALDEAERRHSVHFMIDTSRGNPAHTAPAPKPRRAPAAAATPEGGFRCSCGWTASCTQRRAVVGITFGVSTSDRAGRCDFREEERAWVGLRGVADAHRAGCDGAWQDEPDPPRAVSETCACGWRATSCPTTGGQFTVEVPDRGRYAFPDGEAAKFALQAVAARHKGDCPKAGA